MSDSVHVKDAADNMMVNLAGIFELSEYTEHLELVIGTLLVTLKTDGSVPAFQLKQHIEELCRRFNVTPDVLTSKTIDTINREIDRQRLPSRDEW